MGEISQPAGAEGEELLPADQREGPYSGVKRVLSF